MIRSLFDGARLKLEHAALPQRTVTPSTPGGRSWTAKIFRSSFVRHQIKKRVALLLRLLTDWALFILIVLTAGIGSATYMMDRGSSFTTVTSGPWTLWPTAGRSDSDPYTRAHFARIGSLPLPADIAESWIARTDNAGSALHSSCDYEVVLRPPEASWWSLAVFDGDGRLIQNAAERYTFTSETGAVSPDGRFVALLSRSAGGGNWLPTSGAGTLSVAYTVIDMSLATGTGEEARDLKERVPTITAKGCR
jgi:hypothetical protein